jgi:methanogenic corrinoid protein MtbC1
MQTATSKQPRHPIRVVARRASLTPEVIRAWEARYGVLRPVRTDSGRRLYTDDDVEHLALLRRALDGGRSIGQIASLPRKELAELVREDDSTRSAGAVTPAPSAVVEEALEAVRSFDALRLEAILRSAALQMNVSDVVATVVEPLMRAVGEAWHDGSLGVGHEHLATAMVRAVVASLVRSGGLPAGAPQLVVAAPAGQRHEMGAMAVAALASADGWRVYYLGPDTPAGAIAETMRRTGSRCVALSVTWPNGAAELAAEFRALRQAQPKAHILVGGAGAESCRHAVNAARARLLGTDELRPVLDALRRGDS